MGAALQCSDVIWRCARAPQTAIAQTLLRECLPQPIDDMNDGTLAVDSDATMHPLDLLLLADRGVGHEEDKEGVMMMAGPMQSSKEKQMRIDRQGKEEDLQLHRRCRCPRLQKTDPVAGAESPSEIETASSRCRCGGCCCFPPESTSGGKKSVTKVAAPLCPLRREALRTDHFDDDDDDDDPAASMGKNSSLVQKSEDIAVGGRAAVRWVTTVEGPKT